MVIYLQISCVKSELVFAINANAGFQLKWATCRREASKNVRVFAAGTKNSAKRTSARRQWRKQFEFLNGFIRSPAIISFIALYSSYCRVASIFDAQMTQTRNNTKSDS